MELLCSTMVLILAVLISGIATSVVGVEAWAGAEFLRARNSNPFFGDSTLNNNNNLDQSPRVVGSGRPFTRTFLGFPPNAVAQQQPLLPINRQPSLWRYTEPTKRVPFGDFARNRLRQQQPFGRGGGSAFGISRFPTGDPWDIFAHVQNDPALGISASAEGQRCTADKQCGADMECIVTHRHSSSRLATSLEYELESSPLMLAALEGSAKKKREDEKTCQPVRRDRSKLQFDDDCLSSTECDLGRGLCCQSIRIVRQAPRKACLYAPERHADELCLF